MTTLNTLINRLTHAALNDTDTLVTAVLTGLMAALAFLVLVS